MTSHWSTEYTSAEYHDLQANAMAVSIDGQMAVLAGRRCYMFVKLTKGIEVTKKVSRHSKWDVNVAQWNPHVTHQQMFAAACNQRIDVWNLAEAYDKISVSLKGHSRVISDIDWSLADPNMLASCSVDTFAHIWDLRDGRRPAISLQAVSGSSQVKWNKRKHNMLATAHDSDVRIWDPRNSSSPVKYIAAHLSKIHGLDWSSQDENHMATSSQDCTVKLWHTGNNKDPESKLSLSYPVWRARYTPFAHGLLTALVPQLRRGESGVALWNLDDLSQPVHTFLGHTDVMLEFQWKKAADSSNYQLITWSKDQTLRIWNVGERLQQLCGSLSKQESLLSRIEALNDEKSLESSSGNVALAASQDESSKNSPDVTDAGLVAKTMSDSTLVQEFNLLNQSISNVVVEEFDAAKRRCAVQVVSDKLSVTLDMEFPDAYPNQTPPKFTIRESNLGTKAKSNQLVQMLRDIAIQHVKHNRTCVEPCLRQLAATVDKLAESMLHELVGSFPVSASPNAHQLGSSYMSSMYGVSAPQVLPLRPRISGARFGGPGYLICFTAVDEGSSSGGPDTVRVTSNRAASQTGGGARVPSFHYHLAHSPPETNATASALSVKRGSIKTRNRTRTESRDITTTPKRQQQQAQTHKIGPVFVYDVSCLMAPSRQLAETYSIDTSDIGKMCMTNAKAAADVNRSDLVQTWTIAALTYKNIVRSAAADSEEPWLENPFGRSLVQSLLTHYANLGDVQTLAMLSCLFSWKVNISSGPAVPQSKMLQDEVSKVLLASDRPRTCGNSLLAISIVEITFTTLKMSNFSYKRIRRIRGLQTD